MYGKICVRNVRINASARVESNVLRFGVELGEWERKPPWEKYKETEMYESWWVTTEWRRIDIIPWGLCKRREKYDTLSVVELVTVSKQGSTKFVERRNYLRRENMFNLRERRIVSWALRKRRKVKLWAWSDQIRGKWNPQPSVAGVDMKNWSKTIISLREGLREKSKRQKRKGLVEGQVSA